MPCAEPPPLQCAFPLSCFSTSDRFPVVCPLTLAIRSPDFLPYGSFTHSPFHSLNIPKPVARDCFSNVSPQQSEYTLSAPSFSPDLGFSDFLLSTPLFANSSTPPTPGFQVFSGSFPTVRLSSLTAIPLDSFSTSLEPCYLIRRNGLRVSFPTQTLTYFPSLLTSFRTFKYPVFSSFP